MRPLVKRYKRIDFLSFLRKKLAFARFSLIGYMCGFIFIELWPGALNVAEGTIKIFLGVVKA